MKKQKYVPKEKKKTDKTLEERNIDGMKISDFTHKKVQSNGHKSCSLRSGEQCIQSENFTKR